MRTLTERQYVEICRRGHPFFGARGTIVGLIAGSGGQWLMAIEGTSDVTEVVPRDVCDPFE